MNELEKIINNSSIYKIHKFCKKTQATHYITKILEPDKLLFVKIRSGLNTWYNLVFTKSSNTWSIYANGSLDMNQNNGVGNVAFSLNNMQFGGTIQSYGSNYGKNSIGSVHIYNRALSNSEVLQNFNATKTRFGL